MRISDWSSDVCSSDLPSPALPTWRRSPRPEAGWSSSCRNLHVGPVCLDLKPERIGVSTGFCFRLRQHVKSDGCDGRRLNHLLVALEALDEADLRDVGRDERNRADRHENRVTGGKLVLRGVRIVFLVEGGPAGLFLPCRQRQHLAEELFPGLRNPPFASANIIGEIG